MNPENKVKVAAMSLSASSTDGDDAPYLEWHGLDHMPEQYQIPGLLWGQRWASTPACRAARAVQSQRFAPTNHIVQYLMGEPVEAVMDEWFTLGAELGDVGRFPYRLPSVLLAAFDVASCHVAKRASVTPEIVPYRPNRGVYLAIELPSERGVPAAWEDEHIEGLLAIDGVAGLWSMTANSTLRTDRLDTTGYQANVVYLDRDPVTVAPEVTEVFRARWQDSAIAPELAAPFETVRPWEWDRYRHPG
jgi:hypothetical protein